MNPPADRPESSIRTIDPARADLPTLPCSVVWSKGRPFVLERTAGRVRWVGRDAFGRPCALSPKSLDQQGWSRHKA